MEREKLVRIAHLAALDVCYAEEFEGEFSYIARAMENIPGSFAEDAGNNICAENLRCDTVSESKNTGLFDNAPRKNGEYIVAKRVVGV